MKQLNNMLTNIYRYVNIKLIQTLSEKKKDEEYTECYFY